MQIGVGGDEVASSAQIVEVLRAHLDVVAAGWWPCVGRLPDLDLNIRGLRRRLPCLAGSCRFESQRALRACAPARQPKLEDQVLRAPLVPWARNGCHAGPDGTPLAFPLAELYIDVGLTASARAFRASKAARELLFAARHAAIAPAAAASPPTAAPMPSIQNGVVSTVGA